MNTTGQTRKEEIIITATKLFKEKGYSAVTMRDLAKAVNIRAASLYNHIDSKQDILKTIIISLAEEFTRGMETIKSSEAVTIDKLRAIVALHVNITIQNTYGMASLNNDWMHLEDQLEHYLALRKTYEQDFIEIIQSGIDAQEIRNANPEIIMFSILTTLRSLYLWLPKKEDLNRQELAKNLGDVLINGINHHRTTD
ncbi:TetR family transcriptional regulator [Gelidibacter sediminis]|uniref:TetR family transcriptional regulator n=1 Tax=Gelidibacter sediminis TaxID=1608710 RepID=A0A4R7QA99_9FLAO|nr:TetR/AcrR family transcriptional regulator [Gelidibacter sediminis]TDU43909.1 TetR family transcriptional regulator [Gelidibacter sediminis]